MRLTLLSLVALSLHILAPWLIAQPTPSATVTPTPGTGFPALAPVPKTLPLQNQPSATQFCFIAAGDNRPAADCLPQPAVLSQILNDAQRFKPVFFLWAGDIIYGHETKKDKLAPQYQGFFAVAKLAQAPMFNAPGNHEMDVVTKLPHEKIETPDPEMLKHYLHFMQYPKDGPAYGAFDYGNSHFIALNTEEVSASPTPSPTPTATPDEKVKLDPGYVSQAQIDWLTQDLEANASKAHIFVFMHHPIMPAKGSSGLNASNAAALQALFKNYPNVSYVIAAHEHLYYNATGTTLTPADRQDPSTQGPSYLVSGGAGAPLDSCPGSTTGYCGSFNHYLVFEVDQATVKAQVVPIAANTPSPSPCK